MEKRKIRKIMRIIIKLIFVFILIYVGIDFYKENNVRLINDAMEENVINANKIESQVAIRKIDVDVPEIYLGYTVIAKLEIPKINLNTNVLKDYSNEGLKVCVSKFWGSDPNEIGNCCIAGHNYKKENMFNNLINLEIGDEIYLTDNKNGKYAYTIYDKYKVDEKNTKCLSQDTNKKREITLITCVNYTNNRLIIKAVQK